MSEPQIIVGSGKKQPTKTVRTVQLIAVAVVVALLGGLGFLQFRRFQSRTICSDGVIKQAASAIDAAKPAELKPIAEEVKKTPRFERDPNCLYIVFMDAMNEPSSTSAKDYLGKLEKAYDKDKGFNQHFGEEVKSIDELRKLVSFREQSETEFQDNAKKLNGF